MREPYSRPVGAPVGVTCLATGLIVAALAALARVVYGDGLLEWLADKDFANYWLASRLVLSGQSADLFGDHARYFQHLVQAFGPDYPWRAWSYPPHYLLFVWPLGLMGYGGAVLAFVTASLALYLMAIRAFVGRVDLLAASIILGPFVIANIWTVQNGFLTGALMVAGLALRYERPLLAGVLFGCLTIKPQLGILLPLFLLMERQWTVMVSAAATAILLAVISTMAFGLNSWLGYGTVTLAYQSKVMTAYTGLFLDMMPSVFGGLRALHFDAQTALALHAAVAAASVLASALVARRCDDPVLRASILVLATMVATPYWLVYDFGAAAAMLLALHVRRAEGGRRERLVGGSLRVVAALVPLTAVALSVLWYPAAPIFVLAVLAHTLMMASRDMRKPSAEPPFHHAWDRQPHASSHPEQGRRSSRLASGVEEALTSVTDASPGGASTKQALRGRP